MFFKLSTIMDSSTLPRDLGAAVRRARRAAGLSATEVARRSGRSRDVLHRLERGDDVTVASLLSILRAMGCGLQVVTVGLPTLEQMQARFAHLADDDEGGDGPA